MGAVIKGAVIKNPSANAGDKRNAGWIPGWGRSSGEGNGNPFQYSCLENSMFRGAWRVIVHGVTKSQSVLRACSESLRATERAHAHTHTHTHTHTNTHRQADLQCRVSFRCTESDSCIYIYIHTHINIYKCVYICESMHIYIFFQILFSYKLLQNTE